MEELGMRKYFSIKCCFAGEEKKIPLVLDAYAKNQLDLSDVNRVLELSSIKEFFDKYDYVNAWSDDYYRKYKELSRNAEKEVRLFFQSITENTIVPLYNACKGIFWDEFWKYFYIYKVYDKISAEHFKEIADGLCIPPNELLENKNLVEKFDTQITEMLKNPEYGARFIVDYYMRKDNGKTKCYFPKSLTKEDKYNIVKAYINGDIVNINILDLIINGKSKKSKEFDVDAKLRHLAKKRSERYWNNNTTSVFEYETGVEVSFSPENPDQDLDFSDGIIIAKYNSDWIKNNLDYPTLLNNFIYLFGYTDICMRCSFTARSLKQGIFEKMVSIQGNGMYQKGQLFELLNVLSSGQMQDMFSNQGLLSYTEKTRSKYNTLFELLQSEHVRPEELKEYNFDEFNWLLERGAVVISDGIFILNYERIWILKELNDKGVICLQYKDSDILRKLISKGKIRVESSLLSKPEWEYFDYVLNKAEFSNGLDLRNRYIRDTNSLDEKQQQNDYIVLLKMFTILVIKINEEFCLQDKISKKVCFHNKQYKGLEE